MFQIHHERRAINEAPHSYLAIALLLLAFVVIAPACGAIVAQQAKLPAPQRAQFESAISKFMSETKAPGISVAVVENGEMVWSAGFGKADIENKTAATPETLYRLGSISKPLTATGAMQLWEAGKLDLDAPVQKYCPAFPQKEFPITTREVLGHLGGIRHYKSGPDDLEKENTQHFDDPIAGGLHFFAKDPLVAKPGTKFHYSTQGYTLVGCVMEG
ncbi:MAG TPA: serine hydrolase domain-containing protein, partial [Candidatus Acidoferrales bacterium]|nr:serine hydrolase domain-containing protein [Candidatus Acidoferrales bacterium]